MLILIVLICQLKDSLKSIILALTGKQGKARHTTIMLMVLAALKLKLTH